MNKTSRNYFPSKYHENVFAIGIAAFVFLWWLKLCSNVQFSKANNYPIGEVIPMNELKFNVTPNSYALSSDSTPKVQYFLKLPYTQDQFRKKIDTIYQVSMLLGKSMSVDQSEQYKSLILSVLNNLSKDAKIDSTKNH